MRIIKQAEKKQIYWARTRCGRGKEMVNKTSGNTDFSEKMQIKCFKKERKNSNHNFFSSSYILTTSISGTVLFIKSINLTNKNNPTNTSISQVQLTNEVYNSADGRISSLINLSNFKGQRFNYFCDWMSTNAIRHVKLTQKRNKKTRSKYF